MSTPRHVWSKKAVRAFWHGSNPAGSPKRFQIREGLDAALAEDLDVLVPAMTEAWIDFLTRSSFRTMVVEGRNYTLTEDGVCRMPIALTEELLTNMMALGEPDQEEGDEPTPAVVPGPDDPVAPPPVADAVAPPVVETGPPLGMEEVPGQPGVYRRDIAGHPEGWDG